LPESRQYIKDKCKCEGKGHPRTGQEGPEEEKRRSSTLSLTSALDAGLWSTPRLGRFTPGKETRYPLCRRLGGSQGRSGRVRKISPPTAIRSPDRPACSKSQYRLSYRGPRKYIIRLIMRIKRGNLMLIRKVRMVTIAPLEGKV
jgi:hypothetical protein